MQKRKKQIAIKMEFEILIKGVTNSKPRVSHCVEQKYVNLYNNTIAYSAYEEQHKIEPTE